MSLTSLLKNRDVKDVFRKTFPKPEDLSRQLRMSRSFYAHFASLPLTKRYSLVGTAFDYLLRFYVKRLNPKAITRQWIAEYALEHLELNKSLYGSLYKRSSKMIEKSKAHYAEYLRTGKANAKLIEAALLLAQLDVIYRAGIVPDDLGHVDRKDVADLRSLLDLIEPEKFTAKKRCLLNPAFGDASYLVGGADADLVIDEMLIEIKTTKKLELTRDNFNQLIGYYALYKIGGIDGFPPRSDIRYVGIYFSRYGYMYKINVEEVIDRKSFPRFLRWFKQRASREQSFFV